ncbi:MAG: hypothetical protein M9927_07685 [Anaerolineae bacterium]|nr:hypothetical protein [Anaerolineae bacterium]
MFARTKLGFQIRAHGKSPAAARHAGINLGVAANLPAGRYRGRPGWLSLFRRVPGVYKITATTAITAIQLSTASSVA